MTNVPHGDDFAQEIAALAAEINAELTDWEPVNAGDLIGGKITRFEVFPTKNGPRPAVIVADASGNHTRVWAGLKVLKGQLEAAAVQPGDFLLIRYEGQRIGKAGKAYHAFKIATTPKGPRDPGAAFKPPPDDGLGLIPAAYEPAPF